MKGDLWKNIENSVLDIILKHLFYIQVDGLETRCGKIQVGEKHL